MLHVTAQTGSDRLFSFYVSRMDPYSRGWPGKRLECHLCRVVSEDYVRLVEGSGGCMIYIYIYFDTPPATISISAFQVLSRASNPGTR